MKIMTVGGGAREHAMVDALVRSGGEVYSTMSNKNPGIIRLAEDILICSDTDVETITSWGVEKGVEMAVIGPEAPLGEGIVDRLEEEGIMCASPNRNAAELEISKEFMRDLMKKYDLPGSVDYETFDDMEKVEDFLSHYSGELVVKPVGLTGGKGVKVMGEHLEDKMDVINYCRDILENKIGGQSKVVLEEKLLGEEYTLHIFTDGQNMIPTPLVQDHKRLYEGDQGPNTGGMGSYSMKDGLLPFVDEDTYKQSIEIMGKVIESMEKEGRRYRGVLYGQFMLTAKGPKVIEFNCRWGDPEAMNILPLLESDYVELCRGMAQGDISDLKAVFQKKFSVCKYVVPEGYGFKSIPGNKIVVDERGIEGAGARLFYASVDEKEGDIFTTTSRSLAVVGFADDMKAAERASEKALSFIQGKGIHMRHDIGKASSLQRKVDRMKEIRGD